MKLAEVIFEIGKENPQDLAEALEGKVDSKEVAEMRLKAAKFYLEKSRGELDVPALASEDMYKAILEGIKALRAYFEVQGDLRETISHLEDILGNWVREGWELGLKLHYDGYLFENIDSAYATEYLYRVEDFLRNCEIAIS
ncbi:MAG: hypothetical protein MPF33_10370 [Candidatus Aramenus sp.]|nr:hypothetical protein [Candidatus Aramenus sp.]